MSYSPLAPLHGNIKRLGGLDEVVPRSEGAQGSLHVCRDQRKAIDVAGVDPAESIIMLALKVDQGMARKTYPSRGTPLKSLP